MEFQFAGEVSDRTVLVLAQKVNFTWKLKWVSFSRINSPSTSAETLKIRVMFSRFILMRMLTLLDWLRLVVTYKRQVISQDTHLNLKSSGHQSNLSCSQKSSPHRTNNKVLCQARRQYQCNSRFTEYSRVPEVTNSMRDPIHLQMSLSIPKWLAKSNTCLISLTI